MESSNRPSMGLTRRTLLWAGSLSALGVPFLQTRRAPARQTTVAPRARSVLILYAGGGISHHDAFDPKPDAPAEIAGELRTIPTALPGVRFSELLPQLARRIGQYALIRSMQHTQTDHGVSAYFMLRGYVQPDPTFDRPENQLRAHPNIGSHVARLQGAASLLPPYMCVPGLSYLATVNYYTAGWMGRAYDPYLLRADPNAASGGDQRLPLELQVTADRLQQRRSLRQLTSLVGVSDSFTANQERAFRLLSAPAARQALDLDREPVRLRDRYGRTRLGQSCLLARRLLEAGVPFVTVDDFSWDDHGRIFPALRQRLPELDQYFSTLLEDLDQRGLLESTLVLLLTDFGRTPRINQGAGRDHWPSVFSVIAAGAGIRGGQVIGASDRIGAAPSERPISPKDLAATLYTFLGLDPFQEYRATDGRPVQMLDAGEAIRELV